MIVLSGEERAELERRVACYSLPHKVVVRAKKPGGIVLPPGYFDLIGSIDDETFVRPPQGELPPPVEIE